MQQLSPSINYKPQNVQKTTASSNRNILVIIGVLLILALIFYGAAEIKNQYNKNTSQSPFTQTPFTPIPTINPTPTPTKVPATFVVKHFTVSPTVVPTNGDVQISAVIYNTGDLSGTQTFVLKKDGIVSLGSKVVSLEGHTSKTIYFTVKFSQPGTFRLSIGTEGQTISVHYFLRASALKTEYYLNEVAADLKYKDQKIFLNGIVTNIGMDILDTPYVTLDGDFGVTCYFNKEYVNDIAKLQIGNSIYVFGICKGEFIILILDHCELIK